MNRAQSTAWKKAGELGSIPADWSWSYFGEICEFSQYGVTAENNSHGKYPMLRMNNLQDGKIDLQDLAYIDLTDDEFQKYKLCENDLLVNRTNSYELVGKTALFNLEGHYVCASYIVRFGLNQVVVDPNFVNYFFNSYRGQYLLRNLATKGVSQANINPTTLKEYYPVPVPPLPEQRAIAAILSTWDDAINLTQALIEALQTRKNALMQRLLKREVRFPGYREKWSYMKIGDFSKLVAGGTPNTNNPAYWENGDIPWMRSGEIHLRQIFDVEGRITELGLDSSNATLLPANSVLVALAGQGKTRGTVAINKVGLSTNQSVAAIIPDPEVIYYGYLFFDLDARYEELRRLSAGDGGRGGLNLQILRDIQVMLPPLDEQKKIADVLMACDEEMQILDDLCDEIQVQKRGLIQQLLTGQIRVKVD